MPRKRKSQAKPKRVIGTRRRNDIQQGAGVKSFLKRTRLLSSIGQYALPALGSTVGAAAGTFEAPVVGTISGGVVGAAAGTSLNEVLKSYGYGERPTGKPVITKRTQFATGKKGGVKKGRGLTLAGSGGKFRGGAISQAGVIHGGALRQPGARGRGLTQAGSGRVHKRYEFAT